MSLLDRVNAKLKRDGTIIQARVTAKSPCKTCIWRRDLPPRTNTLEDVERLLPTGADGGPPQACHTTVETKRPTVCAGYLIRVGRQQADVALGAVARGVDLFAIKSRVPLYDTFEEMVEAHRAQR
jgi:hypothetical protein